MRQLRISAFASLALLLAACQSASTAVRVEVVPATPAPAKPAATPEVAVETPTRLLPAFDEGGPAPVTPVVATDVVAPAAPMVAEETPAPVAPLVAEETPAPVAPMVATELPAPAAPMVAAETPAPAAPAYVEATPAPVAPAVVAAAPAPPAPVAPSLQNGQIILAVGQSAQVGQGAMLRLDSLESDSRCQPGVPCTWAGEVSLFFILQGESSTAGFVLSSSTKPKTVANGRAFQLMAYGACPGSAGECATVAVAPTP